MNVPKSLADLVQLENIFDIMDIYLWLSYRFPMHFLEGDRVREAQSYIDQQIQESISDIIRIAQVDNNNSIPEEGK